MDAESKCFLVWTKIRTLDMYFIFKPEIKYTGWLLQMKIRCSSKCFLVWTRLNVAEELWYVVWDKRLYRATKHVNWRGNVLGWWTFELSTRTTIFRYIEDWSKPDSCKIVNNYDVARDLNLMQVGQL